MSRENRRNLHSKTSNDKIILYAGIGVAVLAVIVFALFMYSKDLSDDVKNSTMSLEQMASMANNTQNTESASTEIGKSVEESANEVNTINNNAANTTNETKTNTNATNTTTNVTNTNKKTNSTNVTTNTKVSKEESKKELSFARPVEGEISREYAKDNLIYSATLEEWTTHMGIDIKADKTTVVKSAEARNSKINQK